MKWLSRVSCEFVRRASVRVKRGVRRAYFAEMKWLPVVLLVIVLRVAG